MSYQPICSRFIEVTKRNDSLSTSLMQPSVLYTAQNRDEHISVSSSPRSAELTITELVMLRASLKRGSKATITRDQGTKISIHANSVIIKGAETFNLQRNSYEEVNTADVHRRYCPQDLSGRTSQC